jgi:hypothetical protein
LEASISRRITNSWQRMQQYHYSGLHPVKGRDGAFWSWSILAYIFLEWFLLWLELWEQQSTNRHSKDVTKKDTAMHEQQNHNLLFLPNQSSSEGPIYFFNL